jgi:hypothetical protein
LRISASARLLDHLLLFREPGLAALPMRRTFAIVGRTATPEGRR